MPKILVVTGSVRPNSVNSKIAPLVVDQLEAKDVSIMVADLKEIDLPFYNAPVAPGNPSFAPTDGRVLRWTKMVAEADGVVLVTPEYNHTMSPVQLNAVDWIYKEWKDKPVALVGYGWRGAVQSHATARESLAVNLKAKVGDNQASLFFTKEIDLDGSVLDEIAVTSKINAALDELLAAI